MLGCIWIAGIPYSTFVAHTVGTVASRVLKTTGVETFSRFSIRDPRLVLCDYSRDRRGGGNCNGVATWGADSAQLDVQVNL